MKSKLKVLHLISGGDSGGAKTHLFALLDCLTELLDVKVGCLTEGVFYKELLEKDVESVLFPQKSRFDLSVVGDIAKMINDEHFDVFHVHGARANFIAGFVKKKINIPIVTTMHSDYLLDFDSPIKKLVFTSLNSASLRKIPYFIAVSDNFKDMLIERGFRPNSIHTVYNGMDYSRVPPSLPKEEYAVSRGFKYDEEKVYIAIAARFDKVKGVDVFIKAAGEVLKKRSNAEFLIAGDGVEREALLSTAKDTGFADKIHFLGFEKDIYSFLNIADINCLTSLCESFPYSMLEGAAMGKPMAASRVGGIPSLVRDYETGFTFESGDYAALADRLIEMIDDRPLREKMGENIKKLATTEFTNKKMAETHLDIYKSIISDHQDKKKYDFVVSGYYGFHNNGDDALLKALTDELKREKKDVRIAVLSNKPEETKKIYRVDSVGRLAPFSLIRVMKRSKVLLSGGGSLLQDETSSKSLWYYLSIIKLAKMTGLKVMQFANGFGPVTKPKNIRRTANVINSCVDKITLRDNASDKEMAKIGVTKERIVTADPALLLKGAEPSRILAREGIEDKPYMTCSVREWKKNAPGFSKILAGALRRVAEERDLNVILIPMQCPHDEAISSEIASLIGERAHLPKERLTVEDAMGLASGAELNVAMRLHALIYSVSSNVRTVALRYDPKIDAFMDCANLTNIIDVSDITEDSLMQAIERAFMEDAPSGDDLRERAKTNTIDALELLREA